MIDLRHGDALAVLATLDDWTVDALVTDPPYSSGGMMRGDRTGSTRAKYVQSDSGNQNLEDFSGDNRDQRAYAYWRHGDPTLEYFDVRADAVAEMNLHNPAAKTVVEPAPLVADDTKPSQFLAINTPTGRVNIGWVDGEWPPPELIDYDGHVYARTRFSQLDAETVTGGHVARGGEYDLIVLPDYQPNLDDPGTYPTLEG